MIIEDKEKPKYISHLNPIDTAYLKLRTLKILFPSGFQFILKVPQQINVFQITQVIKNYTILHRAHGLKIQGSYLEPMLLSSTNKNLIIDAYMSQNLMTRQMSVIKQNQFKVEYSLRSCNLRKCPARNYQIFGKIEKNEGKKQTFDMSECMLIARNRSNCHLYGLTKMDKKRLSFDDCQKIVLLISYLHRAAKHQNNQFSEVYQCFQTEKSLYIVKKLNPFLLSKLKIHDKFLMDLILSQIARTFHILQRDQIQIEKIALSDFWMDFRLHLRFFNMEKLSFGKKKQLLIKFQQDQSIMGQRGTIFNKKMVQVLEELFKNCHLKIIELYIPLFHWLKNNRINNYLQFLKYSQIEPNCTFSACNQTKITEIISHLMIHYSNDDLIQTDENYSQQFDSDYQSKTKIFDFSRQITQDQLQLQQLKRCAQFNGNEILEDMSTVKKKRLSKFTQHKPNFQFRHHMKKKKKNNKSKEREKQKSLSTNQKPKTQKRKRELKIFEFLNEY